MSELIEELRHHERDYPSLVHGPLCGRAADEIERLRNSLKHMEGGLLLLQSAVRAGEPKRDISSRIDEEVRRMHILVGQTRGSSSPPSFDVMETIDPDFADSFERGK